MAQVLGTRSVNRPSNQRSPNRPEVITSQCRNENNRRSRLFPCSGVSHEECEILYAVSRSGGSGWGPEKKTRSRVLIMTSNISVLRYTTLYFLSKICQHRRHPHVRSQYNNVAFMTSLPCIVKLPRRTTKANNKTR